MIRAPWVSLQGYVRGNSVDDVKVFVLQTANLRVTVITSNRCHLHYANRIYVFLISNFRRVLNLVCILLGISPASNCCMPTFRNTICSIFIGWIWSMKYTSYFISTCLWRWNRQSVPKRRHTTIRCRGITQKKAYNTMGRTYFFFSFDYNNKCVCMCICFLARYGTSSCAGCFEAVIIIIVIIVPTVNEARVPFRPQYYSQEVLLTLQRRPLYVV